MKKYSLTICGLFMGMASFLLCSMMFSHLGNHSSSPPAFGPEDTLTLDADGALSMDRVLFPVPGEADFSAEEEDSIPDRPDEALPDPEARSVANNPEIKYKGHDTHYLLVAEYTPAHRPNDTVDTPERTVSRLPREFYHWHAAELTSAHATKVKFAVNDRSGTRRTL